MSWLDARAALDAREVIALLAALAERRAAVRLSRKATSALEELGEGSDFYVAHVLESVG